MFGKVCVPRMVTNIVNNGNRNILINCIIKRLVEEDRRILVLSDRRDHLKAIHDMVQQYTSVGYYVGGMKQKDLDISAQKTVILGTYPMSSEGLNIPELDTAVFTTSKSSIEQSIGRIVRKVHEKIPLAIDIVDEFSVFPRQYVKREKVYRKLNYDIYEMHVYADTKSTENTFNYALDKPYKKKEFNSRGKKLEIEDDLDDMTDDELDIENTNGKKTATTKSECFIEDDE
jgi:superfamily II DNA or RNA helicase